MKFCCVLLLAAGAALAPAPAAWAESGSHADSPLKLTEIISRPKYAGLKISPDGKYFAGTAVTDDGKGMLHILDRRTMSVVHSEVYDGPLGVGDVSWHDNENLLITRDLQERARRGAGRRRSLPAEHPDEEHQARLDRRRYGGLWRVRRRKPWRQDRR